jgi:hypothetical protein
LGRAVGTPHSYQTGEPMALDPTKSVFEQIGWNNQTPHRATGFKDTLNAYAQAPENTAPIAAPSQEQQNQARPQVNPQAQAQEAFAAEGEQFNQNIAGTVNPKVPRSISDVKKDDLPHIAEMKRRMLGGQDEADRQVVGLQQDNE